MTRADTAVSHRKPQAHGISDHRKGAPAGSGAQHKGRPLSAGDRLEVPPAVFLAAPARLRGEAKDWSAIGPARAGTARDPAHSPGQEEAGTGAPSSTVRAGNQLGASPYPQALVRGSLGRGPETRRPSGLLHGTRWGRRSGTLFATRCGGPVCLRGTEPAVVDQTARGARCVPHCSKPAAVPSSPGPRSPAVFSSGSTCGSRGAFGRTTTTARRVSRAPTLRSAQA
jgi:hypothetical protein